MAFIPRKRKECPSNFSEHTLQGNDFDEADELCGLRFSDSFRPRKMCRYFIAGSCQKGSACTFAHSTDELHPESGLEEEAPPAQRLRPAFSEMYGSADTLEDAEEEDGKLLCYSALTGPRTFLEGEGPQEVCQPFLRHPSLCVSGDECPFAHGFQELEDSMRDLRQRAQKQRGSAVRPTAGPSMMALGWTSGCKGSQNHSVVKTSRFSDVSFKPRKLCTFWAQDPSLCLKGDVCSFAHGLEEINPDAAISSGVTHRAQPRMCKFFLEGQCSRGSSCAYAHVLSRSSHVFAS